jgi:membrane dipeptidase
MAEHQNNPLRHFNTMKPLIDLHQDLLLYVSRPDLYSDRGQTSFEQLKKNNIKVTIVSAFPAPENENYYSPVTNKLIEDDLVAYNEYVKVNPEFKIIRSLADFDEVLTTEGLFGLILHIEGLNVFDIHTDWDMLERWYKLGLRSIGPVWNISNPFGGGTLGKGGLTDAGGSLVSWCERKGVIFDFAHMNEQTFWDAAAITSRPIFVSHGNARSICDSVRNYTDKQITAIAESGGCIGMFFSKKFISSNALSDIDDVITHITHIEKLVGIDAIGIGSDFGGIISGFADQLNSVDHLKNLIEKLKQKGYKDKDLEKIFFSNGGRVIRLMLL